MVKSILLSRTFWVNALTVGAVVLDHLSGAGFLSAGAKEAILVALGLVNVVLRAITTQPVKVL
jgi:hypothetical protein